MTSIGHLRSPAMGAAILAAIALTSTGASAQIYKCTNERGITEFSQRPCGVDAETVELKSDSAGISVGPQGDFSKMRADNEVRALERKIQEKRAQISRLEEGRERKLAELRNRKRYANNNLAGAAWEESISTEMNSVVAQYSSSMQLRRDELLELQSQLAAARE